MLYIIVACSSLFEMHPSLTENLLENRIQIEYGRHILNP